MDLLATLVLELLVRFIRDCFLGFGRPGTW